MTRAWQTLLRGQKGSPRTVEITFEVNTPAEAEKLQGTFIAAALFKLAREIFTAEIQ